MLLQEGTEGDKAHEYSWTRDRCLQTHLIGRGVGWQHAQHDDVAGPLVLVQICPVVLVPLVKLLKGQVQDATAPPSTFL